jgi:alpha-glucosidase
LTLLDDGPHHDGSAQYVGTDRPALGDTVPVWLRVPHGYRLDRTWVRSTPDTEPRFDEAKVDRVDAFATWYRADIEIVNPLTRYRWLLGGGNEYAWVNGSGHHDYDVPDSHDFRISTGPGPPSWASDAVVYEIFPDRFARSAAAGARELPPWATPAGWDDPVIYTEPDVAHQVYGGDLDGVVEHLDHVQALGFNTLYLTPFFPAGSIHRYDAATFDRVDPLLGGDEALVRLTAAAHDRGIRVIGDLTTNHSGATHEWFKLARADPTAAEREFYYFRDDGSYLGWYNHPTLPKLRFSPELRRRLLDGPESVVGRWLAAPFSLDGWRIDVANMTGRWTWEDLNLEIARAIRRTMHDVSPDALLIAEHIHDASGDLTGDGWHGAMNYAGFLRPVWSWLRSPDYHWPFLGLPVDVPRLGGGAAFRTMREFHALIPWRSLATSWSLVGSHDTPRIRTVAGTPEMVAVAAGLLFTMLGTPMVFMGDELGGEGVKGEDARRPMPWHRPDRWDRRTFERYRALVQLRVGSAALREGGLRWIAAGEEFLLYVRETSQESLLCLAARGEAARIGASAAQLGLPPNAEAEAVYGSADALRVDADGRVAIPVQGPAFAVWRLR